MDEATAQALIRYGFPSFWLLLGVVQWFWPAALFVAFSNDDVTPGARGFAVLWLCIGAALAMLFVPALSDFGVGFIPGFVLLVVGVLQRVRPTWTPPLQSAHKLSKQRFGIVIAAVGIVVLVLDVV